MSALADLAGKGDQAAAAELHSVAVFVTHWLTWLAEQQPEVLVPIAEDKYCWPVLYDPHREGVKENAAFVKGPKLGVKTEINLCSGKAYARRVPANSVALRLHRLATNLRRVPMTSWTHRDWFPLAACGVGCSSIGNTYVHTYDGKYEQQLRAREKIGAKAAPGACFRRFQKTPPGTGLEPDPNSFELCMEKTLTNGPAAAVMPRRMGDGRLRPGYKHFLLLAPARAIILQKP